MTDLPAVCLAQKVSFHIWPQDGKATVAGKVWPGPNDKPQNEIEI